MKKLNLKLRDNSKAITLIALIITIVVLLIIAGVSIAMLTGDNGIITQANKAKEENEKAKKIEMIELYISEINIEMAKNSTFIEEGVTEIKDIPIKIEGIQPNIGWIYVENNVVTKYEFYYNDFYILNVNGESKIENFLFSDLVNVKDFGAIGDGITDDTLAIKEATKYVNEKGGILYFPLGVYYVDVSNSGENVMSLESNKKIIVDFFCSTILLKENPYVSYNVINVNNCTSIELRNGFLVGDRKNHDYTTISATHEFGYGISLNQTIFGEILNMDISDMTGDAIINKNGESGGRITINQSNLHHCRRQGISILDSDVVNVKNTKIHHIGTFDNIAGTAPMTGIDIEPASGTKTVNSVLIDNVDIKDTTSFGIVNVNESVKKIEILNSKIDKVNITNANIKKSNITFNGDTILKNCIIENAEAKIGNAGTLWIAKCDIISSNFESVSKEKSQRIMIATSKVYNTNFKNIVGTGSYNSNSAVDFGIVFNSSYYYDIDSENNNYDNCAILINENIDNWISKIENSYIYVGDGTYSLNNISINNSITKSNSVSKLYLNNCKVNNSGTFGTCKKYLTNTYFSIENLTSGILQFPSGSSCDKSTIQIKGNMTKNGLNFIKFSNNSKVILDKYNSINKIDNQYSTEGNDYTVEYNGDEILK